MNSTIEQLAVKLKADSTVAKFQLSQSTNRTVSGGFLNNAVGGVYRPIQVSDSSGLSYRVEFIDGQASNGSMPASTEIEQIVQVIRQGKHKPVEPIEIAPKLDEVPDPRLLDKELAAQINNEPDFVSKAVTTLQSNHNFEEIENTEGEIEAMYGASRIINSNGVDITSEGTKYSSYVSLNDRIGYTESTRRSQDPKVMQNYSNHYTEIALALDKKPALASSGSYPVLFSSSTGWSILGAYLRSNLTGFNLDAGQSRFTLDDLTSHKQISHEDFSLSYNQIVDMDPYSFKFDGEGIPAQKFDLIKNGKLVEPICDLKSAHKLGYAPRSLGGLKTNLVQTTEYDDFKKKNPTFLLVFGLLGLHSVNNVTGDFSLPSDNILLIQDGNIVGPVNGVFSGNFFDTLMRPSTGFVNAAHLFDSPALTFETQITVK